MKPNWKRLAVCIAVPLLVGALSGLLTRGAMNDYEILNQPPLSPPGWLFPVVWTILYLLMGLASCMVLSSGAEQETVKNAVSIYALQLFFNFLWPVWFFRLGMYDFAFAWLIALWGLIILTTVKFFHISKTAGLLMLPYLAWVTFAAYLNLGAAILN